MRQITEENYNNNNNNNNKNQNQNQNNLQVNINSLKKSAKIDQITKRPTALILRLRQFNCEKSQFLNNEEKCCQPDRFLMAMENEKYRKFDCIPEEMEPKEDKTAKFKSEYLVGKQIGQGAYASVRIALHKPTNRKEEFLFTGI
ncbi:hypothetical protein PPERSA_05054 [Pseudocohnilembus persalinus]|uniref:Protein kinase-like domain n=1 Tax=Pseudocohnilembus persalinus TaxID=266149 RepID=A0A0V0QVN9_PSEPJ|nr:hypothetical protein PPERSA_05054 [Pseudocohnilembus persalinus]|eukprot:KRX06441.1 hypothetical protein PPERSA_05054 [Pseudocohnilembus persalinus]